MRANVPPRQRFLGKSYACAYWSADFFAVYPRWRSNQHSQRVHREAGSEPTLNDLRHTSSLTYSRLLLCFPTLNNRSLICHLSIMPLYKCFGQLRLSNAGAPTRLCAPVGGHLVGDSTLELLMDRCAGVYGMTHTFKELPCRVC